MLRGWANNTSGRCAEPCKICSTTLPKKISLHPLRTKGSGQMEKKGR